MRRALVSLVLLMTSLLVATGQAGASSPPGSDSNRLVSSPAPELTALWWQTYLGIPNANSLDRCDLGTKRVLFLAGSVAGPASRTCSVARGRSLLVPLINVECSTVEGNGETFRELRRCADGYASQFTQLFLTIDRVPIDNLARFRVQTGLFRFSSVNGNVFGVTPAYRTKSVADGYWVQLRPLSPGRHTVTFGGTFPAGNFSTEATYTLTVR